MDDNVVAIRAPMSPALMPELAPTMALDNAKLGALSPAGGAAFLQNLHDIVPNPNSWVTVPKEEEQEEEGEGHDLQDEDDKHDAHPREDGVLQEGEARQDHGTPHDVSADLRKPLAANVETNYTKRKRNAADDSGSDGIASQPVEKAPKKRGKPFADGATTSIAQTRDRRTTPTATYKEVSSTGKRSSKPQATSESQTKASARPRFRTAHVDIQAEYGTALPRSILEAIPHKCIEIAGDFADDAVKIKDFENCCQRLMVESLFGTGSLNLMVNIDKFSHTLISAQDGDAVWATFRLAWARYSSVIAYKTLNEAYSGGDPAVVNWVKSYDLHSHKKRPMKAILEQLQPAWVRKDLDTATLLAEFLDMCGGPAVMLLFPQDWNPAKV